MGKIRFTLTYIVFWFVLIFSCFLIENFAFMSTHPMDGFSLDGAIILSLFSIFLLVIYYLYEHKRNKMTFDKILLPLVIAITLLFVLTIWWQGPREFVNPNSDVTYAVIFSNKEKLSYSLQIVIWGAVIYGLLFAANRYHVAHKCLKWMLFVYTIAILVSTFVDLFMEFNIIKAIFEGTNEGEGVGFIMYNGNLWASTIMIALLSSMFLNIKKFNIFYYICMIHFFIFSVFTTCATTIFIGFVVLVFYTFYEILSYYKHNPRHALLYLFIYLFTFVTIIILFITFVQMGSNVFSNLWDFIYISILQKDYATLSSRTNIWRSVFTLLLQNPLDLIFGLGFKTGNIIFASFYNSTIDPNFALRSCHNGFVEITLRHGLIGLLLYIGALGFFVVRIINLFMQKRFRVASFYGLCFLAFLSHSIMESTTFLSTNLSGLYISIIFFIPIVSLAQKGEINKLKNDLINLEIPKVSANRNALYKSLSSLSLGILISLVLAFTLPITLSHIVGYIYLSFAILALLFLLLSPLFMLKCIKFSEYFKIVFFENIKNNIFSIFITLLLGVLSSFVLKQLFVVDVFSSMIFVFFVFAIYLLSLSILNKKEQLIAFSYINDTLLDKLKKYISEEENG